MHHLFCLPKMCFMLCNLFPKLLHGTQIAQFINSYHQERNVILSVYSKQTDRFSFFLADFIPKEHVWNCRILLPKLFYYYEKPQLCLIFISQWSGGKHYCGATQHGSLQAKWMLRTAQETETHSRLFWGIIEKQIFVAQCRSTTS